MSSKKASIQLSTRVKKIALQSEEPSLSEFSKRKREQIINAALEAFLELGYERTTMNLVAQRAGVIKQTIYSHFRDKEDLFVSVIGSITIDHVQHIFTKEEVAKQTPEQVLRSFADALASRQFDAGFTKLFRTTIGESGRFPKLAELYTEATIKPGCKLLIDYLSNHPDIHLPDPEAFARVFAGAIIHYCVQQHILHGKKLFPFEFKRVLDELIRIFLLCSQ